MRNLEILKKIVDQQLEKLAKLSEGKAPLPSSDIKSLLELANVMEKSEKLETKDVTSQFEGLSPEELILIYEYRQKKEKKE